MAVRSLRSTRLKPVHRSIRVAQHAYFPSFCCTCRRVFRQQFRRPAEIAQQLWPAQRARWPALPLTETFATAEALHVRLCSGARVADAVAQGGQP